jgi:type II secretory pathway pseudopilin PulG
MDKSKNTGMKSSGASGFSLIEAVVSVLILAMIVGGMLLAYSNTTDKLLDASVRASAVAVAERQMEYLLDSRMEPNAHELHGQDELDPRFTWHIVMSREPVESIGGRAGSVSAANSVIKATMRVESEILSSEEPVELIRYLGALEPLPGQSLAVLPEAAEEPWLKELRQKLGREPTLQELIQEMIRRGDMSPAMAEELGVNVDTVTEPPGTNEEERNP